MLKDKYTQDNAADRVMERSEWSLKTRAVAWCCFHNGVFIKTGHEEH